MEVPAELIYVVISTLSGCIGFMSLGFIYVFKEVKKRGNASDCLLKKYIAAYAKLEAKYHALKEESETLREQNARLAQRLSDQ